MIINGYILDINLLFNNSLVPDKVTMNTLLSIYTSEKFLLNFAGLYPNNTPQYLHKMLGILIIIFEYTQFVLMALFVFLQKFDVSEVTEALLYLFTQIAFLTKFTNFYFKKKIAAKIDKMLSDPLLGELTEEEMKIMEDSLKDAFYFSTCFRICCVFVVLFYAIFPLADGSKYPLRLWFPFDEDQYHILIFVAEILSIAIGAWYNSNFDILCIKHISIGTGQFEVLKYRLRTITTGINDHKIDRKAVMAKLQKCVEQYDAIYRYVLLIEENFSVGIFIQFAASICVICITGFQMLVTTPQSFRFGLLVNYLLCMLCQVVMYCWFGHFLFDSSSFIADACYMSDWLSCDVQIRKALILIMERARRPISMRAMNLFTLSLPTLITILKSSYSYFAVLNHLYQKT